MYVEQANKVFGARQWCELKIDRCAQRVKVGEHGEGDVFSRLANGTDAEFRTIPESNAVPLFIYISGIIGLVI